jgi:hypothetical protein
LLAAGSKPLTDDEQLYLSLLDLGECMFLGLEKRYAPTQETSVNLVSPYHQFVKYACVWSHHVISSLMHLWYLCCAYTCNKCFRRSDVARVWTRATEEAAGSPGVGGASG